MTTPQFLAPPATAPTCECGHLSEQHDEVAARYCQATLLGDLHRGCICPDPA